MDVKEQSCPCLTERQYFEREMEKMLLQEGSPLWSVLGSITHWARGGADLKTSGIILTGREALCVHTCMFVCKGVRARVRETGKAS